MENRDPSYFFLAIPPETLNQAVVYGEWETADSDLQQQNLKAGDIVLFYSSAPIEGIVGFGTIKNKTIVNGSSLRVEFSRNYCLPKFLWEQEKINTEGANGIKKGLFQLTNREQIGYISNILNSKWGADLKNNIPSLEVERPFFSKNVCLECGKELDSRIARYCLECREKVKQRQSIEWNKANIDKIREANKKWRLNNPEKLKEYRKRWKEANREKINEQKRRWKELHPEKTKLYLKRWRDKNKVSKYLEKLKQPDLFSYSNMSDWCKDLRRHRSHLSWMVRQKKRIRKIIDIENKFNCCWEDKFKEVFERFKHEEGSKILDLDYHTLFIWARHLKLKRLCIYCNKKLATAKGNFHSECKIRYESTRQSPGIQELFSLIDPAINIGALNLKDESIKQVIMDMLSSFSRQESSIIENRYLYLNRKQTLEELGNTFQITRERVRQIEQKIIKKLSHPSRQKIIREKLNRLIFKDNTTGESSLTGKINKLQKEINQLKQKFTHNTPEEMSTLPLTEIELSVRAVNCLKDAKIETIGELANKTEAQLLSFKNLGKKTLLELKTILESFGLKFRNGTPFSKEKRQRKNDKLNLVKRYLTLREGKVKNKKWLLDFIAFCNIPPLSWDSVTAKEIERFNNFKLRQGRSRLNISSNMSILRDFFNFLQKKGLVEGNITRSIVVSAGRRHIRRHTFEELKEIHSKLHPRG